MSKRKVCRGKKKFKHRNTAAWWAADKRYRYRHVYRVRRCEFCRAWHVDKEEKR